MKKKVLSFALVMVLVFSSVALPNFNIKTDALTSGYFSYTVRGGYAAITKYNGSASGVVVPSYIGGYRVNEIDEHAFSGNKNIKTVRLPDAIVSIGAGAFYNCINLADINIPINWSYTNIFDTISGVPRAGIFENCTSLKKITIPKGKTFIPDAAFYNAQYIEEVVLPNGLESIGYRAFGNCHSLMKINLQNTKVREISDMAFHWNYSLQNLTFPNTLEYIGEEAFCDCVNLLRITIPANVTVIGDYAFNGCEKLQYVTIPRNITYIDGCTFEDCSNYLIIYGYVGSYAESYAKRYNIEFMPLDILGNHNYIITPRNAQNSSIEIAGGSVSNGANVQIWEYKNSPQQQFQMQRQSDGSYVILACHSGKVLDIQNGRMADCANVQLNQYTGSNTQKWILQYAGNDYYYICSKANTNYVLDVYMVYSANGTNIQICRKNGGINQQFKFTVTEYTIIDSSCIYALRPTCASTGRVEVADGATYDGGNIQFGTYKNTYSQHFIFKY